MEQKMLAQSGAKFKRLLKAHGYTQESFAEAFANMFDKDTDVSTVKRWCKSGIKKTKCLFQVAIMLNVDAKILLP